MYVCVYVCMYVCMHRVSVCLSLCLCVCVSVFVQMSTPVSWCTLPLFLRSSIHSISSVIVIMCSLARLWLADDTD